MFSQVHLYLWGGGEWLLVYKAFFFNVLDFLMFNLYFGLLFTMSIG